MFHGAPIWSRRTGVAECIHDTTIAHCYSP